MPISPDAIAEAFRTSTQASPAPSQQNANAGAQDQGPSSTQGTIQQSEEDPNKSGQGGQEDWASSSSGIMNKISEHMASLNDAQKKFVAAQLTPETVALIGLVTGSQEMTQYFMKFADPNKVLVPMDRKQTAGINKPGQGQPAPVAPQAAPAAPTPAAPQQNNMATS